MTDQTAEHIFDHLRHHIRYYIIALTLLAGLVAWGITAEIKRIPITSSEYSTGRDGLPASEKDANKFYGIKNWPPALPEHLYDNFTEEEEKRLKKSIKKLVNPRYQDFEDSIYRFEQAGKKALPLLTEILDLPNYEEKVYLNVIYTIGRMGKGGDRGAEVLFNYLHNDSDDIRIATINALGRIGVKARHSVVYLRPLLRDENPKIRQSTKSALLNIGTSSALRAAKRAN